MALHYSRTKKSKPKNDAKARALAEEWEAMLAKHSKPLERGAKSKGVNAKRVKVVPTTLSPAGGSREVNNSGLSIRSVQMSGSGTKPIPSKDMQDAIHKVSSRVGMSYNKGGLQYLTDDELNEQRTGAHKRRS